jgi:hypothetical protein
MRCPQPSACRDLENSNTLRYCSPTKIKPQRFGSIDRPENDCLGRIVSRARGHREPPAFTFNEVTKAAAKQAELATKTTSNAYKRKYAYDEDDLTGALLGSLLTQFHGVQLGGITLDASIPRHRRGIAAEESRYGADLLIRVAMDTPTQKFSKGVLIQAKKSERSDYWSTRQRNVLIEQCNEMLRVTPAAFVFHYSEKGIRCGAASRVAGATDVFSIAYLCGWSAYRFFLELFRCPIGDPRISSANVASLPEPEDIPFAIELSFKGEPAIDEGSSVF